MKKERIFKAKLEAILGSDELNVMVGNDIFYGGKAWRDKQRTFPLLRAEVWHVKMNHGWLAL